MKKPFLHLSDQQWSMKLLNIGDADVEKNLEKGEFTQGILG
jgi:hypothetical protein